MNAIFIEIPHSQTWKEILEFDRRFVHYYLQKLALWCLIKRIASIHSPPLHQIQNIQKPSTYDVLFPVCPFLLITPHTLQIYRGKNATFDVAEEAKVHSALEVRWQKSKYDTWDYAPYLTYLNITERKYHGSVLFHSPKLVINDAQFEDEGYYRIQVRIREGWCNRRSVNFQVRGSKYSIYKC